MTKFITVNNKKGGTGKTATSALLAVYFSKIGKTCVIDADESGNCTKRFTQEVLATSKLCRIFEKQEVFPMKIRENLDLVAGTFELEKVNTDLINRLNRTLLFKIYLNRFKTFDKYDYVVIDTRNDSNIITNNMLVVSDLVLGVTDPSADGYEALINLQEHVRWLKDELFNLETGQSYVNARVVFLGNKIAHNTSVSNNFKQVITEDPTFIGYLQERTAFEEASLQRISLLDLFDQEKYQQSKYKEFKSQTYRLLERIKKCVDSI